MKKTISIISIAAVVSISLLAVGYQLIEKMKYMKNEKEMIDQLKKVDINKV